MSPRVFFLALLVGSCAGLAPSPRRAVLQRAAAAAAAASFAVPQIALADLVDLDDAGPAQAAVAPKAVAITMQDAGAKKEKLSTPASRLKELQAKKDLTDKEKKEMRQLKADEMCEMLGRGCECCSPLTLSFP